MESKAFLQGYEDSICITEVISFRGLQVFGHQTSDHVDTWYVPRHPFWTPQIPEKEVSAAIS